MIAIQYTTGKRGLTSAQRRRAQNLWLKDHPHYEEVGRGYILNAWTEGSIALTFTKDQVVEILTSRD